jgi:dipeptidyl aminopeptidase/acylaminoacyl peptidase
MKNLSASLRRPARLLFVLLCVWTLTARAEDPAPLIPLGDFFRNPELSRMDLSPDGDYVAYLASFEHRQNLYVKKVGDTEGTRLTNSTERDVGGFFWIGSQRLAYTVDLGGKENWRIYAVDRDGANPRPLTPESGVQAKLVAKLPHDEDHLLISLNQRDPRSPDLYKIDVKTGQTELVVQNDRRYVKYVSDNTGTVRLAVATDGVNVALFHRLADGAPFQRILTTDFRASVGPLFFTADNRYFYALSNRGRDKAAVVVVDPKDGAEIDLVYQHPDFDAGGLMRDSRDLHLTGAFYVGEKLERVFFDERLRNRQLEVARQLPGRVIDFVSASRAGTEFIVKAWSDRDPGTFYHYREASQQLTKLGAVAPWIDPEQLASIKPVSYRSRDGLTLHGYLTRPKGAPSGPLPTLVVVHGGPWARDQWRADPEVQFLANRGYAVLQINFRGSIGYGRNHVEAGFKQWGRAMQDDITDGVRWLIDQKIADPKRVGIYGISYGGYATLCGLAFTPELYRCGIDDSGVSDIGDWLNALPPAAEAGRAMLYTMVGHPDTDRDALAAVSPLRHVDRITAPLLIAHGGNDPRVKKTHAEQIVAALTARGREVEYLAKANEGHSFHLEENKMEFYRRAERFLAKNLGGREADGAP